MSALSCYFNKSVICVILFLYVIRITNVESKKRNGFSHFSTKRSDRFQNSFQLNQPYISHFARTGILTTTPPTVRYWHRPYGNSRKSQTKTNSGKRKVGYEPQNSSEYGYQPHSYKYKEKVVEKDDTIDGLTGVIGPLIFPIPFLLAILPFAIPAIPIALSLPFGNSSDNETSSDFGEG